MYELLAAKPEGEAKLLSGLVNKLGDPNRKIASKAGFLLAQLLTRHPVMKPIVAREVRAGRRLRCEHGRHLPATHVPISIQQPPATQPPAGVPMYPARQCVRRQQRPAPLPPPRLQHALRSAHAAGAAWCTAPP